MEQSAIKPAIRYSEAFKIQVVRQLDSGQMSMRGIRIKYGIKGAHTVRLWVRKYGNGNYGKVIRVEKPKEIDEKVQLKKRIRQLERALANATLDLAIEREYTAIACEQAGVEDVVEFKKKAAGKLPMN